MVQQTELLISTQGAGLYLITAPIQKQFKQWPQSGLLNCFIQHTSASLLIQENASPSAKRDLEEFFRRLAPEGEPWHQHLDEGPDDTTSHFKAALTNTSLTIPVTGGRPALGTWQGIYLFEHRLAPHERTILLTLMGEK